MRLEKYSFVLARHKGWATFMESEGGTGHDEDGAHGLRQPATNLAVLSAPPPRKNVGDVRRVVRLIRRSVVG